MTAIVSVQVKRRGEFFQCMVDTDRRIDPANARGQRPVIRCGACLNGTVRPRLHSHCRTCAARVVAVVRGELTVSRW